MHEEFLAEYSARVAEYKKHRREEKLAASKLASGPDTPEAGEPSEYFRQRVVAAQINQDQV
jgi:hypothetical protein